MCGVIARTLALVALLAACGDPPARVRLVPVDLGTCGKPSRARVTTMRVIAYARDGEHPQAVPLDGSGAVSLSDVPANTEQLGVVLSSGSQDLAEGKSAPLDFESLPNGTAIPVAVLPVGGFCAVMPMSVPRVAPKLARAGDGVLVVGGTAGGSQISTAEYYDRTTGRFSDVQVPTDLAPLGFEGAALTELADGKVLITGPQHVALTFDPVTRTFIRGNPDYPDSFGEVRAFHAAAALDATRVIVAGGCRGIAGDACDTPIAATYRYDIRELVDETKRIDGPTLGSATQDDAQLFDLGTQLDGTRRMVLAGSRSSPETAERIDPESARLATEISGFHAQVAPLDGGALLTALEPDGSTQTGAAGVLPPEGTAVVPVALFAQRPDGARLVALEDGSVLAAGGDANGDLWRYDPTTDGWNALPAPPSESNPAAAPVIDAPALARLADGSILVLGGTIAGQPSSSAWLYRPSLVGPSSGLVEADRGGAGVLVPSDPSTVSRPPGVFFELTSPGDALTARALVGGPRTIAGSVKALVQVRTGGVALVAQQLGPGRALVGELLPGQRARITRLGVMPAPSCTGRTVPAFDPNGETNIGLAVTGQTATLSVAGTALVSCDLSSDPGIGDRGSWGIAADGAAAKVDVVAITVAR